MKWTDIVTRKQNILLIYTKAFGWCEKMKAVLGAGFNHMLMVSYREATTYYVYKTELLKLIQVLTRKIDRERTGKKSLAQRGIKLFKNVIDYLRGVTSRDISGVSNKRLASYFQKYFEKQITALPFLVLPTFVDDIIVTKLQQYIDRIIKMSPDKKTRRITDCINILTTFIEESYTTREEQELLEIALQLSKTNFDKFSDTNDFLSELKSQKSSIYKLLVEHTKRWEWLPIQAEEEPYGLDHFASELQKLITKPDCIKKRLGEIDKHKKSVMAKKNRIIADLKINYKYRNLLDVFQEWNRLKDYRRAVISQERLYSRSLYAEIGKRSGLTGREVRFMNPDELVAALGSGKLPSKEEIHDRMEMFVLHRSNKTIVLLTGVEAENLVVRELPEAEKKTGRLLRGIMVSSGIVKGEVKIIFGTRDTFKIKSGNILVARQTTPDLLSAIKKSAAIITDEGGLLCHAAIISREMRKPCIIGTKIATKVLKDGDLVEVDANKGAVKILKHA